MSWKPAFEIGFWNAWILTLFIMLHPLTMIFVDQAMGTGNIKRKMGETPVDEGVKKHIPIPSVLLIIIFIYSIFLPLMLGTIWLSISLTIYLVGILVFLNPIITSTLCSWPSSTRGMTISSSIFPSNFTPWTL